MVWKNRCSSLLLTHVSVKSELILSSKSCPNFRGGVTFVIGTIVRSLVLLERRKRQSQAKFKSRFFIKIDLDEYISRLESEGKQDRVEKLRKLLRLKLRE